MRCSHRMSTVFELLAASRFRLEPHWNRTCRWVLPARTVFDAFTVHAHMLTFHFLFFTNFHSCSTCSCTTLPPISVGVCSFHNALASPALLFGCTLLHTAIRPQLVPPAKISIAILYTLRFYLILNEPVALWFLSQLIIQLEVKTHWR